MSDNYHNYKQMKKEYKNLKRNLKRNLQIGGHLKEGDDCSRGYGGTNSIINYEIYHERHDPRESFRRMDGKGKHLKKSEGNCGGLTSKLHCKDDDRVRLKDKLKKGKSKILKGTCQK